jgi:hypothetical protein
MKRFTETAKWDDPWFRRLRPEVKLLWQWILDRCDNAGVIDPDLELASFQIGFEYPSDALSSLGDRVVQLDCGKWFIPKFIAFQYGQLSADCKAHKPIFASIEKHSLERVSKGYPKGIHTLQEKEKETVQEKEPEKEAIFNGTGREPRRPTLNQAISQASNIGMTTEAATAWWQAREASDWQKATAGGSTTPVGRNWQADMANSRAWATEMANKISNASPRKPRTYSDTPPPKQ